MQGLVHTQVGLGLGGLKGEIGVVAGESHVESNEDSERMLELMLT